MRFATAKKGIKKLLPPSLNTKKRNTLTRLLLTFTERIEWEGFEKMLVATLLRHDLEANAIALHFDPSDGEEFINVRSGLSHEFKIDCNKLLNGVFALGVDLTLDFRVHRVNGNYSAIYLKCEEVFVLIDETV